MQMLNEYSKHRINYCTLDINVFYLFISFKLKLSRLFFIYDSIMYACVDVKKMDLLKNS